MPAAPQKVKSREASKSPGFDTDASSDDGHQEERQVAPPARRQKPRQKQRRGGPLGETGLDNLALDSVGQTAKGATSGVTNTLGNVAGSALDNQGGGKSDKSDTLRLRLDLNLDIEITLKARIHGDLELALLN